VLAHLENTMAEGTSGVEHGVAVLEATVPERDEDLWLGDETSIEVAMRARAVVMMWPSGSTPGR